MKVLPENRARLDRLPEDVRSHVARRLTGAADGDRKTDGALRHKVQPRANFVDRRGDSGAPGIALVHPVGGYAFCYEAIVRALPADVASYCVHHPDAMARCPASASSIESLAHRYRRTIEDFGGPMPRVIAGWSFGGVVAHEMARQWEQAGGRLDAVVLIDSPLADGRALQRIKSLVRHGLEVRDLMHDAARLASSEDYQRFAQKLCQLPGPAELPETEILRNIVSVCAASHAALLHHRFGSIQSPLHYLLASRSPEGDGVQGTRNRLRRIASGPVYLSVYDEDHFSILTEPTLNSIRQILVDSARGGLQC